MTNTERFKKIYEKNLTIAYHKYPEVYYWPQERLPHIVSSITDGLANGSANKDSHAIKWTCKELGINHTYKAIKEFLTS